MSQQLGNEVERQGKANKPTTPRTALTFQRKAEELPWMGFEPTTLCSLGKRSVYQLSYLGNSTGRGLNLQHNTTQHNTRQTSNHSHSVCTGTITVQQVYLHLIMLVSTKEAMNIALDFYTSRYNNVGMCSLTYDTDVIV